MGRIHLPPLLYRRKPSSTMQTMSQTENKGREMSETQTQEDLDIEDWAEAAYFYTLYGFEETLKSKRFAGNVWKDLSSEAKAIIRNFIAIEQLKEESKRRIIK